MQPQIEGMRYTPATEFCKRKQSGTLVNSNENGITTLRQGPGNGRVLRKICICTGGLRKV